MQPSFTEVEMFERLFNHARDMPLEGSRSKRMDAKYAQTEKLILMSCSEEALLLDLQAKKAIFIADFYGDPECGVISQDSSWAAVGGYKAFAIWQQGNIRKIAFSDAFDMRQSGPETLLILENPWFENAHIWEYNIRTADLKRIRPFTAFAGEPYNENPGTLIW